MKNFKFLSGAVCLFLFIASCDSEPIIEDIDTINSKLEVVQNQPTTDESITVKPNEQSAQRSDGEDDDPNTKLSTEIIAKPILTVTPIHKTDGQDDDPNG